MVLTVIAGTRRIGEASNPGPACLRLHPFVAGDPVEIAATVLQDRIGSLRAAWAAAEACTRSLTCTGACALNYQELAVLRDAIVSVAVAHTDWTRYMEDINAYEAEGQDEVAASAAGDAVKDESDLPPLVAKLKSLVEGSFGAHRAPGHNDMEAMKGYLQAIADLAYRSEASAVQVERRRLRRKTRPVAAACPQPALVIDTATTCMNRGTCTGDHGVEASTGANGRRRGKARGRNGCVTFFFANVTSWNKDSEKYFDGLTDEVCAVAETHLGGEDTAALATRAKGMRRFAVCSPAAQSRNSEQKATTEALPSWHEVSCMPAQC